MKKKYIEKVYNSLSRAETTSLDPAHEYKLLKFLRLLRKEIEDIIETEEEIMRSLNLKKDERGSVDPAQDGFGKYIEMRKELMNEVVEFDIKKMPYDIYHKFCETGKVPAAVREIAFEVLSNEPIEK